MKIVNFLCKRFGSEDRPGKIPNMIFSLFYAVVLFLLMVLILDTGAAAAAAVSLLTAFVTVKFKIYKFIYRNSVVSHITVAVLSGRAAESGFITSDEELGLSILKYLCIFISIFGLLELFTGFLMSSAEDGPHPENLGKGILFTLPLYFTVFMYIPSETYINNISEFLFTYSDILPHALIMTAVFTLITALIACALDNKSFLYFTRFAAGLTFAVYCQYMFMNGDLPDTLLSSIDWDALRTKSVINALIWVVIILLPFIAGTAMKKLLTSAEYEKKKYLHCHICIFLGAIQFVSLAVMLMGAGSKAFKYDTVILSGEEQYTVSSKKNIITFIVDMADQYYFDDAFEAVPEKKEIFKDFTCYTNTCMVYDATVLSIPQMLSGTTKFPGEKLAEWYTDIWNDAPAEEFYSRLHDNGYTVNIFGSFCSPPDYTDMADRIDNEVYVTKEDIKIYSNTLNRSTDSLAALRYLPLALKKNVESEASMGNIAVRILNQCNISNADFADSLSLKLSESDKNYFIVEHIEGTHEVKSDTKLSTTVMVMDILNDYMEQLKDLGVYDDSVIIITADHGEHWLPDGAPIWFIKQAGTVQNEMSFCSSPIYLTDYLATCLDSLGLREEGDEDIFGRSIYDIPEDEERRRLVFLRRGFRLKELEPDGRQHTGHALYGFYFTGDKTDLKQHALNDPPDMIFYIDTTV